MFSCQLLGQARNGGTVRGEVRAKSNRELLGNVNVAVIGLPDSSIVTGGSSNHAGFFEIGNIPHGKYFLRYSLLGYKPTRSLPFTLDDRDTAFTAGTVYLQETTLPLGEVTVTSQKPVLNEAIDRKVYNVQQDILSKTGSVSDLLQNIPSVQVDVDGTVSLRGSTNVQILINGKPSPMLAGGSSDILQQIPATSVETIEVITNPSAKFKPEGTSGLINIVLKKDADLGLNGNLGANIGTSLRYNATASGNYKPGALNIYGTYSFRQDERNSYTSDVRQQTDVSSQMTNYTQTGHAFARPYSHFLLLGLEYQPDDADKFGLSGTLRRRAYTSTDTSTYLLTDNSGSVTSDYDRRRIDYDQTPVTGGTATYQHDFLKDDHTLRFEVNASHLFDEEDNHFTNVYRVPPGLITYDNRRINEYDDTWEATADYHLKISEHSVLEAGYDGTFGKVDFPFTGEYYDTTMQAFVPDTALNNHFAFQENIHAFYGTYEHTFGALKVLGGLRLEAAQVTSDLISSGYRVTTEYTHLYPTLHLAYRLDDFDELQLNYSLRVNRPEADELNPFPEYQNPRSLRSGNPLLKPEFIHSVELGLQMQTEAVSIVPGIFYRNRYNGFTNVTRSINDSTLLTTEENLSTDQSGGFEFVLTGTFAGIVTLNASANAYYEVIDASDLGYGSKKSAISWNGSLNCNIHATKGTMFQVNSNYRSARLTPQGRVLPGFILNLGFRQDLFEDKLSLIATVSDVLATLNRKLEINTATLQQNTSMYRDSRVFFLGLMYHFGTPPKQSNDKPMQYDDNG